MGRGSRHAPPSHGVQRSVTAFDRAVKPLSVAFTHGAGSVVSVAQAPADVRPAATTRAWKLVAFDAFGTVYVNAPVPVTIPV